ncbi:MAG: hypothetical protein ABIR15_18525 [Chitinophagaceae bacterium]
MASEDKNSVTISKSNAGFPPYLDFNKLRSEGIAYLGKLSGQLWTDHNVHDPGITILEELCYALLDLGYRTNLPVEDILSSNPGVTSKENNFFTPAQILSCNPLTVIDYRKLLIDIPGVRNAWLAPATDITNICRGNAVVGAAGRAGDCDEFLNGIYHVFIETETDVEKDFENDDLIQQEEDRKTFIEDITGKVKVVLMAHRNLCEDFADIFILCKIDIGVCASIEVEDGADVENVYVAVADRLRAFFSNVPKFYTLPQMLDKGKSIEEIFSGRPYSSQSNGFVDTEELEAIELKREIHTSDIYNAIFEVPGVKKISKLRLRNCGKKCDLPGKDKNTYWKLHLPENHIPEFSISCSGFEFTRKGMPLPIDQAKFATQLELGWLHTGKVLYSMPSPYLDATIPTGIYHDDLDSYYSIQNDFPVVYGIGEGDLADSVSDKRKAQALQLKGYLFFFDQMLANYLSQLKNIRQLFSFAHPADKKEQHTYFLNTISTVPELNKLLRFGTGDEDNGLGTSGTLLAFPVAKKIWQLVDTAGQQAETILDSLDAFTFNSLFGLYEATDLLRNDLVNDGETIVKTYATADGMFLYTIESSTEDFILLSKKISATEADALRHAASVQYAGVFENNYRSFLTEDNRFTFNIELNIDTYTDYLGILVESDDLYIKRRKDFLNHLLSRFSEQFTDFVLLNWKPGEENDSLQTVEEYLSCYPDLSRNRGRAYDYLANGYKDDNVSGFEKKVKALAGIPPTKHDYLCNFTVEPFDESYVLDFSTTGITNFQVTEKFDTMEDATAAASSIIKSMGDQTKYTIRYLGERKEYELLLDYGAAASAVYHTTFNDSNAVEGLATYIAGSFSQQPAPDAITEHSWKWAARIKNNDGTVIKTSADSWTSEDGAENGSAKLAEKLNDTKKWKSQKDNPFHGKLFYDKSLKNNYRFIDITAFNIDINDTIIGKPGMFSYDVLDKGANSFKLSPLIDFTTAAEAEAHCQRVLVAAADESNYNVLQNTANNSYQLQLLLDGKAEAASSMEYAGKEEAQKAVADIVQVIKSHAFSLDLLKTPVSWKFKYRLGYDDKASYTFYSENEYDSEKAAADAVQLFYKHLSDLRVEIHKDNITLSGEKKTATPSVSYTPAADEAAKVAGAIKSATADQHSIARLHAIRKPETLRSFVKVDRVNTFDTYVYRLVNKNNIPAVYSEWFADAAMANDKRKEIAAVSKKLIPAIPGICLGGDIYEEVYDASDTLWYRYQIMFYNVQGVPGNQLTLFESVKAFVTADEAVNDFYSNYLLVLLLASDRSNYGKYISTAPADISNNAISQNDAIAFIPAGTLKILQDSFGTNWNDKLVEIVTSYPVKIIDANSTGFAELFCAPYTAPATDCKAGEKDWKYYFSIPVFGDIQKQIPNQQWRSTAYYDTPEAALEDFRYFSRLLMFTGNYFVDCGCTRTITTDPVTCELSETTGYSYKIFIHEVLAQSIDWFERKEDAWGPKGVEKFICAAQSGLAFKNYQRRDDCCYSFYVTCGDGLLEHPCKYDTEKQRDAALENLYKELNEFVKNNSYGYTTDKNSIFLKNQEGKPFAQVSVDQANQKDICEWYVRLAEEILSRAGTLSYTNKGFIRYTINNGEIVIRSAEQRKIDDKPGQDAWIAEWSKILWYWACYFPVSRTRLKTTTPDLRGNLIRYKYCVEIKLPGFNLCDEDAKPYQPCDCDDQEEPAGYCNIAWKGTCCYNDCATALAALKTGMELLLDQANYHSVFDCDCHSFGIALNTIHASLIGSQIPAAIQSDVIAINPQCYETNKDVCAAAETAMHLINSQGMHLIEHILLRPYTQNDCECRNTLDDCNSNCVFPDYTAKAAGGCNEEEQSICFKPGTDPYSFIATVVLPAWSSKFRQEANRLLLENLLYREAPAHVLLRILWLKPVDFCSFETAYDGWRNWIAGANTCNNDFSVCRFLELLFSTRYDCLDDCTVCIPCTDPVEKPLTCIDEDIILKKRRLQEGITDGVPFEFVNQVNKIYCFDEYCEQVVTGGLLLNKEIIAATSTVEKEDKGKVFPANIKTTIVQPKNKLKKAIAHPVVTEPVIKEKNIPTANPAAGIQLKAKAVNARFRKYKTDVAAVLEQSDGNPLAGKTDRLLNSQQADAVKLDALVTEIIQNSKSTGKGVKKLNKKQQLSLVKTVICFYLDKISFNGKDELAYNQLNKVVQKLVKAGFDLKAVYTYWNAEEVVKVEPGMDIDFVNHIITGAKK